MTCNTLCMRRYCRVETSQNFISAIVTCVWFIHSLLKSITQVQDQVDINYKIVTMIVPNKRPPLNFSVISNTHIYNIFKPPGDVNRSLTNHKWQLAYFAMVSVILSKKIRSNESANRWEFTFETRNVSISVRRSRPCPCSLVSAIMDFFIAIFSSMKFPYVAIYDSRAMTFVQYCTQVF